MEIQLSPIQVRILGALVEKSIATPDYYPMTLNSLVAACNQKSNRNPVMTLDEDTVTNALEKLRFERNLVGNADMATSRTSKYRHNAQDKLQLTSEQLSLMCELWLRGPQTAGELRTHTSRLHPFESPASVEAVLRELADREDGSFVVKLPREPGRRERRYAHLFCGEVEIAEEKTLPASEAIPDATKIENERIKELEEKVASLQEAINALQQNFNTFKKQFE